MIQLYAAVAAAAIVFGGGWQTRSWYEASVDQKAAKAQEKLINDFRKDQYAIADVVEQKIEGLRANERVIEKWRTKVVDRPVFNIECIDDDGMRLIKDYANGFDGGAAKLVDKVP